MWKLVVLAAFLISPAMAQTPTAWPWRLQGDIALGTTDPEVTVFVGPVVTDYITGQTIVYPETREPVTMLLSELIAMINANPTGWAAGLVAKQKDQIAAKPAVP